jgi:HEAT repeat protein
MIVINCPGCRKRYELSAALAGKKSRCRQCGEVFAIAVPQQASREPAPFTMAIVPEEPSRAKVQAPPESYWESVLADDGDAPQKRQGSRPTDYDNFDVPAPSRVAKPAKKKSRSHGDTSMGAVIAGSFAVVVLLLFAAAYGAGWLGLVAQSNASKLIGIALGLTMMGCSILIIWGTVWLIVVAFRENARCGLMFLFVPLYPLYYIFTRLADTKGPASMVAMAYLVMFGMAILGPAVDPNGALRGQANAAAQVVGAPGVPEQQLPPEALTNPGLRAFLDGQRNPAQFGPPPGFGPRGSAFPKNFPRPGIVIQTPEQLADQIKSLHERYGNKAVVVVFTGVPTNNDPKKGVTFVDAWQVITARIKALAPAIEHILTFGPENQRALIIAPIDNPPALAQSIDFGKVTLQRDTRIRVDISPEFVASVPKLLEIPAWSPRKQPEGRERKPEAPIPSDADAVTKSLLELKSADMGKKRQAIHRLARATPDQRVADVVAALLPLLDDDDGFLVNDVIKVLMVWRSPAVLSALIERANDSRFFVRAEAVKALGKFKDARAVDAIIPHLKEDRFAAEAALKEIGPMAEVALIIRLQDPEADVRRIACDILKQIGGVETLKAMRSLPRDSDPLVRMAANSAYQQIAARVGPLPKTSGSGKAGKGAETKTRP